ncbi:MAG: hypothetical protein IPK32_06925 [Verrucomicrobiaceae bacterium]|nr:hypothetical protein [Verrucomicrobiaceae bacterium]
MKNPAAKSDEAYRAAVTQMVEGTFWTSIEDFAGIRQGHGADRNTSSNER